MNYVFYAFHQKQKKKEKGNLCCNFTYIAWGYGGLLAEINGDIQ